MKLEPRDLVVFLLVFVVVAYPVAAMVVVLTVGRPLTEVGTAAIEQIMIAVIAIIAGYVAGKGDKL